MPCGGAVSAQRGAPFTDLHKGTVCHLALEVHKIKDSLLDWRAVVPSCAPPPRPRPVQRCLTSTCKGTEEPSNHAQGFHVVQPTLPGLALSLRLSPRKLGKHLENNTQLILIICGFCLCKISHSENVFVTPNQHSQHLWSFADVHRMVKTVRSPPGTFSTETEQGSALTSRFGFHTINEYPLHGRFSVPCFVFLCFLLVTSLFKTAPKHSAAVWCA